MNADDLHYVWLCVWGQRLSVVCHRWAFSRAQHHPS